MGWSLMEKEVSSITEPSAMILHGRNTIEIKN